MCYESVKHGLLYISEYLFSFIIHQGGYLFILFLNLMYERLSEGNGFPGTSKYTFARLKKIQKEDATKDGK